MTTIGPNLTITMLVRPVLRLLIKHNMNCLPSLIQLNNTTHFDCLFVTFTLSGDHDPNNEELGSDVDEDDHGASNF